MSFVDVIGFHWRGLFGQFVDSLFPPRCVGCGRVGTWLCAECLDRFAFVEPPLCAHCGVGRVVTDGLCARCRTSPLQIDSIRSVFYFEGPLREAIHCFKYQGRTELADPLGNLMAAYWMRCAIPVDVVVPVPLHPTRLRERGYNQAALLAREMAGRMDMLVDERALARRRATRPQVDLNAGQRRENVRDAFHCSGDTLIDKQVLLIDDVCTTGATLEACGLALYAGGVCSVRALTLARPR